MALFIGLMSGTSMDAIDAALLDIQPDKPVLVATHKHPLDAEIRNRLLTLISNKSIDLHTYGYLDAILGNAFATAANQLLITNDIDPATISAIGSHGQTIYHSPHSNVSFSLQIGDPNRIAQQTGITTVADFRRRDMAAGGQGAPLAPAFHNAVFRSPQHNRVILNIGGIANITLLDADFTQPVIGFDTGPGNCLLDSWAQRHLGLPMDIDGRWAAGGRVNDELLQSMLRDDYFKLHPPKSTGREHFNLKWLSQYQSQDNTQNIQATLCSLTVETIAQAITINAPAADELYVCGGGAHNVHLMDELARRLDNIRVATTTELGIAPEWVEAAAFAWLAQQTLAHRTGNLPSVTGASEGVILGAMYPGQQSL